MAATDAGATTGGSYSSFPTPNKQVHWFFQPTTPFTNTGGYERLTPQRISAIKLSEYHSPDTFRTYTLKHPHNSLYGLTTNAMPTHGQLQS